MSLIVPKVVYVTWRDCETLSEWASVQDVLEFAEQDRIIKTVGFLIDENEDRLVLSSSWETQFGKIAGSWIIPRAQVVQVNEVTVTGKVHESESSE